VNKKTKINKEVKIKMSSKTKAEYIGTTDVAKLIRKELKTHFPATKFSVRSERYSGGSSIDVSWTDGVPTKTVDKIIKPFEGSKFDGMIDLKTSKEDTYYNGKLVCFGVDYVFAKREFSEQNIINTANELSKKHNLNQTFTSIKEIHSSEVRIHDQWLSNCVYEKLHQTDFTITPQNPLYDDDETHKHYCIDELTSGITTELNTLYETWRDHNLSCIKIKKELRETYNLDLEQIAEKLERVNKWVKEIITNPK